jgi:hypothetical protein
MLRRVVSHRDGSLFRENTAAAQDCSGVLSQEEEAVRRLKNRGLGRAVLGKQKGSSHGEVGIQGHC